MCRSGINGSSSILGVVVTDFFILTYILTEFRKGLS